MNDFWVWLQTADNYKNNMTITLHTGESCSSWQRSLRPTSNAMSNGVLVNCNHHTNKKTLHNYAGWQLILTESVIVLCFRGFSKWICGPVFRTIDLRLLVAGYTAKTNNGPPLVRTLACRHAIFAVDFSQYGAISQTVTLVPLACRPVSRRGCWYILIAANSG